jgi:CheY-like chemotaxis protein
VDGFSAISATDGKEGVEKAVAEKPDLILMNSIMPEMDGWEATRVLRANPETKDIPILAATAMLQPSHPAAHGSWVLTLPSSVHSGQTSTYSSGT